MNRSTTQTPSANFAGGAATVLTGAFRPAFSARLVAAWSAYKAWRNRRHAMRELRAMPDWMLRDIGIERRQIRDAVYNCGARTSTLRERAVRGSIPCEIERETKKAA